MSTANYPNGFAEGVTIRGVPLTVAHPGEVFWVNSTSVLPKRGVGGQAGGPGTYKQPFATITQAIAACTANRGDIVMVMPGYTETIAAAAGEAWNVAGVAIIGLGGGSLKPTFTFNGVVGADIDISAANVSVYNFRFVSGLANITNALDITGANVTVDSCEFMASAAGTGMNISATASAAAYGIHFTNNTINFESSIAGVSVTDVPNHGFLCQADNAVITGNWILGSYATAAIGSTSAGEGLLITDNSIFNIGSVAAGGISMHASATGLAARNMIRVTYATNITTLITAAAMGQCENYLNNATAESGGKLTAST